MYADGRDASGIDGGRNARRDCAQLQRHLEQKGRLPDCTRGERSAGMPTTHQCTQMAAECVAWAKNTSDPARRSALMLAAQNWKERAAEGPSSRPFRPWEPHHHEIQ